MAVFVSGLALGATIVTNAGLVSHEASVIVPALAPDAVSFQQHRKLETSLGASRVAIASFDVAHHVRRAAPQYVQGNAAMTAVRYSRRAEFGVGGP